MKLGGWSFLSHLAYNVGLLYEGRALLQFV